MAVEYNGMKVQVTGEDGNVTDLAVVSIFKINDKKYLATRELDKLNGPVEDVQFFLFENEMAYEVSKEEYELCLDAFKKGDL